jgi:hypothetical protein
LLGGTHVKSAGNGMIKSRKLGNVFLTVAKRCALQQTIYKIISKNSTKDAEHIDQAILMKA